MVVLTSESLREWMSHADRNDEMCYSRRDGLFSSRIPAPSLTMWWNLAAGQHGTSSSWEISRNITFCETKMDFSSNISRFVRCVSIDWIVPRCFDWNYEISVPKRRSQSIFNQHFSNAFADTYESSPEWTFERIAWIDSWPSWSVPSRFVSFHSRLLRMDRQTTIFKHVRSSYVANSFFEYRVRKARLSPRIFPQRPHSLSLLFSDALHLDLFHELKVLCSIPITRLEIRCPKMRSPPCSSSSPTNSYAKNTTITSFTFDSRFFALKSLACTSFSHPRFWHFLNFVVEFSPSLFNVRWVRIVAGDDEIHSLLKKKELKAMIRECVHLRRVIIHLLGERLYLEETKNLEEEMCQLRPGLIFRIITTHFYWMFFVLFWKRDSNRSLNDCSPPTKTSHHRLVKDASLTKKATSLTWGRYLFVLSLYFKLQCLPFVDVLNAFSAGILPLLRHAQTQVPLANVQRMRFITNRYEIALFLKVQLWQTLVGECVHLERVTIQLVNRTNDWRASNFIQEERRKSQPTFNFWIKGFSLLSKEMPIFILRVEVRSFSLGYSPQIKHSLARRKSFRWD